MKAGFYDIMLTERLHEYYYKIYFYNAIYVIYCRLFLSWNITIKMVTPFFHNSAFMSQFGFFSDNLDDSELRDVD